MILVSSKGKFGESGAIKVVPVAIGALVALILILVLIFFLFMGSDDTSEEVASDSNGTTVEAPVVEVPIQVQGAFDLGSLLVEFNYDRAVLELQTVTAGALARNALIESNQDTPGMVRIGLVEANGINGDGVIITLVFALIQLDGSSPFTLESVEVSDTDLRDLVVQVNSSQLTGADEPFIPPALIFRP